MRIRIKRAFDMYKVGQEFVWPRGMCRLLVARGLVEEIVEPEVEAAAVEPEVEVAAQTKKPTRRKK